MVIKVGINGFGRIGRIIFRTCIQNSKIQLSAINDPAIDIEYICYLIKFDSTHGKFKGTVSCTSDGILINDREIKVFREKLPSSIPWHIAGVQYVVEASGMFTCLEKASGHLQSEGVRRVLVTAPSIDVPMVVLGVNDHKVDTNQKILSCVSSTLYCLAPIIKILDDNFGIQEGFVTSIHAMTPSLKPLDGLCLRGKHWRDHRSIHQNIIPATTGACKALGKIIPQVKDKMSGLAFRVPIANVSLLDLSIRLEMSTTLKEIFRLVEEASRNIFRNIISLSNEAAVSSDFIGDNHSCIVDVNSTLQLKPNFFKIICWYENEYSYACRVIDTIFYSESQFRKKPLMTSRTLQTEQHPKEKERDSRNHVIRISNTEDTKVIDSREVRPKLSSEPKMREASLITSVSGHSPPSRDTCWKPEKVLIKSTPNRKSTIPQIGSFFHSCTTFAPKATNKTEYTAQELNEKVEKDFCRTVDPDDLLIKSCNTSHMETSNKLNKVATPNEGSGKEGLKDTAKEKQHKRVNNRQQIGPQFDVCGDYDSNSAVLHKAYPTRGDLSFCSELEAKKSQSDYNIIVEMEEIENSISNTIGLKTAKRSTALLQKVSLVKKLSKNESIPIPNNFKGNVEVASTKALIQELHLKYKEQLSRMHRLRHSTLVNERLASQCAKTDEVPINPYENNMHPGRLIEQKCSILRKPPSSIAKKDLHERHDEKDFTNYLSNQSHNIELMDKELKKRNIVLLNDTQQNTESSNGVIPNHEINNLHTLEDGDRYLGNGKFEEVDKYRHRKSYSDMCYGSPANTMTTISRGYEKRNTLDLYDKLDSNSATDSNQSFDINQRKSQVINFSDLSNSLEDLARLDKICKIIEISDDLSDKLFSSLDKTEIQDLHQKQWSFRDLCKRIKLDDFCNQVFGKPGV